MSFHDTKDYTELTATVIAQAILEKVTGEYQAYIMVDGLNDKERGHISKTLQRKGILVTLGFSRVICAIRSQQ